MKLWPLIRQLGEESASLSAQSWCSAASAPCPWWKHDQYSQSWSKGPQSLFQGRWLDLKTRWIQIMSWKSGEQTQKLPTNIWELLVKFLKWKVGVFWIVEAGDDVASILLRNKLLKSHLSHSFLQHSSVVFVSLFSPCQPTLLMEFLQSLSECQDGMGWWSKPE